VGGEKLRRGEVWIAKQSCNCHLEALLVWLLAWHAQASDPQVDTWHGGRFIERWADRRALDDLRHADARSDSDGVARALWATVDVFEAGCHHRRAERDQDRKQGQQETGAHTDGSSRGSRWLNE